MIYLLDTDTLIFMVRGLKIASPRTERQKDRLWTAKRILARCRERQEAGDHLGLSAITVAELEFGARKSGNYEKEIAAVRKILVPFACHHYDASFCAQRYGEIRHHLESKGILIGAMDLLIASHARALGATLVTNNTAHFSSVPALSCENWVSV